MAIKIQENIAIWLKNYVLKIEKRNKFKSKHPFSDITQVSPPWKTHQRTLSSYLFFFDWRFYSE